MTLRIKHLLIIIKNSNCTRFYSTTSCFYILKTLHLNLLLVALYRMSIPENCGRFLYDGKIYTHILPTAFNLFNTFILLLKIPKKKIQQTSAIVNDRVGNCFLCCFIYLFIFRTKSE